MGWTVLKTEKNKVALVSKSEFNAILPKGSYLTIEDGNRKFILRVDETYQHDTYSPQPLIADLDLSPLVQDQKCQNIVFTSRMMEIPAREDGNSSFIKPQMYARKSNQDEVDLALDNEEGMLIFPATVFARSSRILQDESGTFINAKIPDDVFFHQTLITGRTGSGKTVAMKHMAQYFLDEFQSDHGGGAVIAINVKEEDFLTMDKASNGDSQVHKEWSDLNLKPKGIETFKIYYPGNNIPKYSANVNIDCCEKITLHTKNIDPEVLSGLIQNITERGANQLPSIFRYWQQENSEGTMKDFIRYFADPVKNRAFDTRNSLGETFEMGAKLHHSTHQSLLNSITNASENFDIPGAKELNANDLLKRGKLSVIDVTAKHGFTFGSILLRDLLDKIYEENSNKGMEDRIPVLIIIDEVHEFYKDAKSREALQALDLICRKGRSLKIGVVFASQNPEDMPKGISSVVNSKIYFKSDTKNINALGIKVSGFDPEALKPGYGVARIHGLSQLNILKFPLALAGVNIGRKNN